MMAVSIPSFLRIRRGCAVAVICVIAAPQVARADDHGPQQPTPQRPAVMFNRWQEDWSVLADPRVQRQPFDELKYIPLSKFDPYTYLSFGADTRDRFESNDAQGFGTGPNRKQDYVISRNEFHADLRIANQVQVFVQLQNDFAPWKTVLSPADQDRLDLEQAFVALTEPLGDGTLRLRVGRQQVSFDLQRFVSVRDGPNVRQSFDAGWAEYERGPWRFNGFYGLPVQVRVNLLSFVSMARAALPALRRSGRGSVINVSSTGAVFGRKGMGAYDASKAAVLSLTRTLAFEEAERGVRVNTICPGYTRTPFHVNRLGGKEVDAMVPPCVLRRWGTPAELAYPMLWLASDEASYVTAATFMIDGGFPAEGTGTAVSTGR
jgi:hypothetical protein